MIQEINGIYYELDLDAKTAVVRKSLDKSRVDIVIPSTVQYDDVVYCVNAIGERAFEYCNYLTSIVIPKSVESIGEEAFFFCHELISVFIPDGVNSIGISSFNGCRKLTSITIPNSVTSIGRAAFYDCGLTSVVIPNSVKSIGKQTFQFCDDLSSISIPESVSFIDNFAFNDTSWYDNQPDGLIYINNILYAYKGEMPQDTIINVKPGTTAICGCAFMDCRGLVSITIPDSVTHIGTDAFKGTSWYDNQPDGLMYINNVLYAYKGEMPQNTIINVKLGTTTICGHAFRRCGGLISITIPDSVTYIGEGAFVGCSSLVSITIPNGVTYISEAAFFSCEKLTSIVIPESVTSIEDHAFGECTGLTSITINSDTIMKDFQMQYILTDQSRGARCRCVLGNSVTSIGFYAFSCCYWLTSITIPNSVTSIGDGFLNYCKHLQTIYIPQGMTDAFCRMGLEKYRDKMVETD